MAKMDWNLDYNEQETVHMHDVEFHVKKRIPHEKKMEMIEEYTSVVAMIEDDGSANWNPYSEMYWLYLILKYYTDIELYDDDNIGWIHDFDVEYGLEDAIREVAKKDINATYRMANAMVDMVLMAWEQSHSLQGTLSRLTSDKELEKLAHAAPLNEELIDLLKNKQEIEAGTKVVPLMEFAKKDK